MNLLKFGAKRMLASMHLEVRRVGEDTSMLSSFADADPVTFQYLSDLKVSPRLTISLSHARAGIMGFSYERVSTHPLASAFLAAKKAREDVTAGSRATAVRGILSSYYALVRPATALEVVNLDKTEAPGLQGIPVQSWVMPWSERSIDGTTNHRRICLEEEGLASGRFVTLEDGATLFGPVTEKKLSVETTRIVNLAVSMEERGYQSNVRYPIEVLGLRVGKEYRWLVIQGQHRLAACAAFDVMKVEARIVRLIRREDAEFWPHVVMGTFTLTGALKCFDRLFDGSACTCAMAWLQFAR